MLVDGCQRDMFGPKLKCITVYSKPEITCQCHKESAFPAAVTKIQPLKNLLGFLFEAFRLQTGEPTVKEEGRQMRDQPVAGRIMACLDQFLVVFKQVGRIMQFKLGDRFSVGALHFGINVGGCMQNDRIVSRILVVVMTFPVGSTLMNFHISHPDHSVQFDFGIEEVRTGIRIGESGINNFHFLSCGRVQRFEREKLVFPYVM